MDNAMAVWLEQVASTLEVTETFDVPGLLAVTRDVAHNIARPAAPLTLLYVGAAIGAGGDQAEIVARVKALIEAWDEQA